jgi:uncharacterized membrane protein
MRLAWTWYRLTTGFWFRPVLTVLAAIVLYFLLATLDAAVIWFDQNSLFRDVFAGNYQAAQNLLSTLSGGLVTLISVTLSLTMVVLTVAAGQYGPRLLNTFIANRQTQGVFGFFLATFVYCLLLLRGLRADGPLPTLSLGFAIFLAIACVFVLIYFLHHVATLIKAETVVDLVERDLDQAMERLCTTKPGDLRGEACRHMVLPDRFEADSAPLYSTKTGYLQLVDADELVRLASSHTLVIHVLHKPGDYLVATQELVRVWPRHDASDVESKVLACFVTGKQRTIQQDIEYAVDQLVEVALRALSPGVNDVFTALGCIDRLSGALARMTRLGMPEHCRYDEEGELRLVLEATTYAGVMDAAFNQIRQAGAQLPAVYIRILERLTTIASMAETPTQIDVIRHHGELLRSAAAGQGWDESDMADLEERFHVLRERLDIRRAAVGRI